MEKELRPFWNRFFDYNWKFGLFLVLLICIPRFALVLNANATGNYSAIGIIMLVSAIAPFIFLSKYGRETSGFKKTGKYNWLLLAFISGLLISILLYFFGKYLYGNSFENWYVYIAKSYKIPAGINSHDRLIMFSIMAAVGATFSPVGEEVFFRGIVHSAFERSLGEQKAAIADSTAFAITHISHFGLVYIYGQWKLFTMPALIWTVSIFLLGGLFFAFSKYTDSVWGAIVCHAAFNLGMIYCIFYLL